MTKTLYSSPLEMSNVQMLRTFVHDRLTIAIEEIFEVFERTITECEGEVCRLQAENDRQRRLLDVILKPEIRLFRTGKNTGHFAKIPLCQINLLGHFEEIIDYCY